MTDSDAASPTLSIDRLTVHAPAMSEADAHRLAELIAEALREWPTAPTASGRVAAISATVDGPAPGADGAGPEQLAARIAQAVLASALRELS